MLKRFKEKKDVIQVCFYSFIANIVFFYLLSDPVIRQNQPAYFILMLLMVANCLLFFYTLIESYRFSRKEKPQD